MGIMGAVAVPHPPIIIPEIGNGEENQIRATSDGYRQAMGFIAKADPDTIVLTSPHSVAYTDYFHISPGDGASGDFSRFRAHQVKLHADYDKEFSTALSALAQKEHFPAGPLGERDSSLTMDHGTMVPLYFLAKAGLADKKIVRIGLSGLGDDMHYKLGQLIQTVADQLGRKTIVLASGDLSHRLKHSGPYGFKEEGPVLDAEIQKIFQSADFLSLMQLSPDLREAAAECGVGSFEIMAGALDGLSVEAHLLSYEGPFGVGYGVAIFQVTGKNDDRRILERYRDAFVRQAAVTKAAEDSYVRLARQALETYVKTGTVISVPDGLEPQLTEERAGTFVSLKKHGRLRGCIGTIAATQNNIAEEIIGNAINAGVNDPRFEPLTPDELPELVYSVDVLGQAEPTSRDGLDAKKYGVIVSSGMRRGVLLPNLSGVDTPDQQIAIALEKAHIRPTESYSIERFEVIRHK